MISLSAFSYASDIAGSCKKLRLISNFSKLIRACFYSVAYLSSYHEKAIKALKRARLGVVGYRSTTLR